MPNHDVSSAGGARPRGAIFLDRDGVLVEDAGLLTRPEQIRILPGVPEALVRLKRAGWPLLVVSNQAVVARGLLEVPAMLALHREVERQLCLLGGPALDGFYFCPHHPRATLAEFRLDCSCRKPEPGLLLQAAAACGLDLQASFLVGDRPTDILAGARAGCRTLWVRTGQHDAPLIETRERIEALPVPDWQGQDLAAAAAWILAMPG